MLTQDAIQYYGSARRMARALGVQRHAISMWGKRPPIGRQYQIEVLTRGALCADRDQANPPGNGPA